jgi:hypothetical protein
MKSNSTITWLTMTPIKLATPRKATYKFTNSAGVSKFGRYRVVPQDGNEYLDSSAAAKKSPNFLFDDVKDRIARGAVRMRIEVQVASEGDVVDDPPPIGPTSAHSWNSARSS